MRLEGSCHCGAIRFEIETDDIFPLMWCYCGRCRKTNGSPVVPHLKAMKSSQDFHREWGLLRDP